MKKPLKTSVLFIVAGACRVALPGRKQMLDEKHINHGLRG
jgi:hypothetical protein